MTGSWVSGYREGRCSGAAGRPPSVGVMRVMLTAVTHSISLEDAYAALDECEAALEELETRCCMPDRSPRMKSLGDTIAGARSSIERVGAGDYDDAMERTFEELKDAGSQIGWLQVGCCAPDRLPLYHTLLEGLTTTRKSVGQAVADVR